MEKLLNDQEFFQLCETASLEEMAVRLTEGNIRGLENIALRSISTRKTLPLPVRNVLLAYFFNTFANEVYDRNDLARIYDYWTSEGIQTLPQAIGKTSEDITQVLKKLKES
ncbi:hypothetical protein [Bacillus sp. REN3]|uniref:hypothetical protein n=1 Tax=Bacillus sp. REN3 TaxID=2802440 RepID=UPI001AEDE798|nr:hypothetical protein [Bacillus sp. REN3]